ncbi:DUF413 domain-containing protein [Ferrimonas sediminicola]|uniref:DUF413 domain-containing protein n=1 Tax=Ferrimonas sediminicola TaxID=2569538 RepID=UPI00197AF3DB|nr:DUF413 domain-containing protein [Ferrimonas sediminicola]
MDNKRYARGFNRSGDFTIGESNLLTNFGDTMLKLATGQIDPLSDTERRFQEVCQARADAETPLERVWLKYQKLAHGKPRFYTLHDASSVSFDLDTPIDDD